MVQIVLALSLLFLTSSAIGGAKTIGQKKDYTLEQKIRRGDVEEKNTPLVDWRKGSNQELLVDRLVSILVVIKHIL